MDPRQRFTTSFRPDLLGGVTVIEGKAASGTGNASERFTAIPYYTWANRGNHDMTVWISRKVAGSESAPSPATASADEAWASRSRD
jgi:hypothetical protein